MSKNDFIQQLIKGMGNDAFGRASLRKIDHLKWKQLCTAEICRLHSLSHSELETLYHDAEGLYEMAA